VPSRLRSLVMVLLAVSAWAGARPVALAQTSGGFGLQPADDPRLAQNLSNAGSPFSPATDRFTLQSGAGATGYDSTNVRRQRAAQRARSRAQAAPQLSGAQAATARALSHDAPQRYRREVVPPPPGANGTSAPLVIVPIHRRQRLDPEPFAPLGVRAGSFLLFPSVELIGGYDSNPLRLQAGKPDAYTLAVVPELLVRSQWTRHALNADIRGGYLWYSRSFANVAALDPTTSIANGGIPESLDRPNAEARVIGRLDVHDRSHADAEARLTVGTDNPGSPNISAGLVQLPIFTRIGGSLGYTQNFNRLDVTVKGGIDRVAYQDSLLTDGSKSSNEDREYQQYSWALRSSYELTPAVRPFVEVLGDARRHDLPFDRNGIQRNSDAITGRGGTTFEFSRLLTGEASAGYLTRRYKDPTLPDLSGLVADASLIWVPTGLTTVTFTARSASDESVVASVSGLLRRDFIVQVDHAWRRWLIGTFRAGMGFDDYASNDTPRKDERFFLSAALVYKLSRDLQVRGELRRDWLKSSIDTASYEANAALIGIKWQR